MLRTNLWSPVPAISLSLSLNSDYHWGLSSQQGVPVDPQEQNNFLPKTKGGIGQRWTMGIIENMIKPALPVIFMNDSCHCVKCLLNDLVNFSNTLKKKANNKVKSINLPVITSQRSLTLKTTSAVGVGTRWVGLIPTRWRQCRMLSTMVVSGNADP